MSAETEDEFLQRMATEGDLGLFLCEYVWGQVNTLDLGGQEFGVVGCGEVPGYEDEDMAVLLRRLSDGKFFEADIDVTIRPALTPEERAERAGRLGRFIEINKQLSKPEGAP